MKKAVLAWLFLPVLMAVMITGCGKRSETVSSSPPVSSQPPVISADSPKDFPVEVNGLTIETIPKKVVVLSPSLAEIVSDMGLAAALCARADECDYPESVAALPSVGEMLVPDVEAIARLQPDFVLMQSEPADELARMLEERGITVLVVPSASDWDELEKMYAAIGKAFAGAETGADKTKVLLEETIGQRIEAVSAALGESAGTRKALYVADARGSVATGDTLIGALLEKAGAVNVAKEGSAWTADAAAIASAEVIFCPAELVERVKSAAAYAASPAVRGGQVYGLDTVSLERQGQRIADAVETIAKALYPEAFAETPSGEAQE